MLMLLNFSYGFVVAFAAFCLYLHAKIVIGYFTWLLFFIVFCFCFVLNSSRQVIQHIHSLVHSLSLSLSSTL